MWFIFVIIIFLYILLIGGYYLGWKKIRPVTINGYTPRVSVIIAIRNEERIIDRLLESLQSQIYSQDKIEFILINDHSSDKTLEVLRSYEQNNIVILNLPNDKMGKKQAIMYAIDRANGDIILTSDADCNFSSLWVQRMVKYFIDDNIKLVSGPVRYKKKEGLFSVIQSLEFSSLIVSGAGAIGNRHALFCNGANLAYRKDVFSQFSGYNQAITSGDDVFLLHYVKKLYPKGIFFAKDEEVIVETEAVANYLEFINQRKRWTSKSIHYRDIHTIYSALVVFLTNLSLIILFFLAILDTLWLLLFIALFLLKFTIDLIILVPILNFFQRKDLIKWIFPFELFYSFYIILIVVATLFTSFTWKGRVHKY